MLAKYLEDTENYDSISQFTDSTLPSDYVAQQIAKYEYNNEQSQIHESDFSNNSEKLQVVNIHVDSVNIFGESEDGDVSASEGSESIPMKNFNEVLKSTVLKNIDAHRRAAKHDSSSTPRVEPAKNKSLRKIVFISGTVFLIGTIVAFVTMYFKSQVQESGKHISFVDRNSWNADLARIGSKPLRVPVKRVIVKFSNATESCDITSCHSTLIREQFSSHYPERDDIEANFIIGTDGTVFEGRGFFREGQMTFDRFGTSYNNALQIKMFSIDGISIENQIQALQRFIDKFVNQTMIEKDYKIFYYDQFTLGEINYDFYNKLKSLKRFVESEHEVKR